jgi:hypothetical protein
MKFDRQDLLRTLESCSAGLNTKENMEQSSCYVFMDGVLHTYNGEILCRVGVANMAGEPFPYRCAVPARTLLDTLRKSPDLEVDIDVVDEKLTIKGTGRRQNIKVSTDILLETDEVEQPGDFTDLPPIFSEALGMVAACAAVDAEPFALNCVDFTPRGMQATNKYQAMRFVVATGATEPHILARATSCKALNGIGAAAVSYTRDWIHWKTYSGLIISVRRLGEEYPDITSIFTEAKIGEIVLPGSATEVVDRAMAFVLDKKEEQKVMLQLRPNTLIVKAESVFGDTEEEKPITYDGADMDLQVNPSVLSLILKHGAPIAICDSCLRIKGDGFLYAVSATKQ